MTVTALRFKDDQYEAIKKLAEFNGVTVPTFMRQTILERLEDEQDYHDALVNLRESHGETVSRSEIKRRLGM
ncbi:type II toxin-antitoxin system RelB family antitoxin [Lactiplantibacillus fabifermentans]|uniref:CopG family transcriptional regulator n=2 Tax=Lactiplantibacillus fabifermentans TaxID=483011 RepID=A0A0R2NJN9_9LACO|nr:DUF6290 family protein [Lactiplantibacillus fabifermentans]ETY75389.1 hypothetical protein LFAB_01990 [Lactiplantibacillus fabifermentans T30PCM01]KRO25074.1 hypothetical protein DY78_GL001431 [Lactiplantibacillus fabifermentans DSM 21115]